MKQPLIVGGVHEEVLGMELLNRYGQKRFSKETCPLINKKTLLLFEGDFQPKLYAPEDAEYALYHRQAENLLNVQLPRTPRLAWKDERYHSKRNMEFEQHTWIADHLGRNLGGRQFRCRSLEELVNKVRKTPSQQCFHLVSPIHRRLLSGWRRSVREFDEPTLHAARKNAETHEVIIVCGAGHALALHRATNWQLRLFIPDTEKDATNIFVQYSVAYDVTQNVNKR